MNKLAALIGSGFELVGNGLNWSILPQTILVMSVTANNFTNTLSTCTEFGINFLNLK